MFGLKSKKPRERFYLLPGQGGKNFFRKQQIIMLWTVGVSLFLGLIVAAIMWWAAHTHP